MIKHEAYHKIITISAHTVHDRVPVIFMPLRKTIAAKPAGVPRSTGKKSSPVLKKTNVIKKYPVSKLPAKKTVSKIVAPKKFPVTKLPPKKEIVKEIIKEIIPETPKELVEPIKEQELLDVQPLYIGRDDLALLETERAIQYEIKKYWQSPAGLAHDLVCILKVVVAASGTVKEIIMKQSSRVLMFDMAARTAVLKAQYPKATWGKEILLQFGEAPREL